MAFIDMIQIIIKMFKNPLKYQQGGQLNEQQQQMLAAFIDWLPKRVKEFQGMQPDAIVQALDGMSKTPEGQKQVQQLMEQFQQESQSAPSAKRGGKIQDFICKHGRGGAVAGCGCEKLVEKAQDGTNMPYTRGSYQSSDYFNNVGTWIQTPKGLAQNYRPYTFGGRTWGFGGNDLEQILVVPGENGTPRRAVRKISNWFNPDVPTERLDTIYQDANGNRRNSAEFEARVNRELEGISGSRPTTKENGGKVEKAQEGSILDYYSNKWDNDLSRIKSGWNRFKESAPGRVWGFFTPNPNSENGMLGAAAPIGKIKYIPEGVSGTEKAAKWVAEHTPNTPHIVSLPPRQVDETQGAKIVNGLREWLYGKWYNGR